MACLGRSGYLSKGGRPISMAMQAFDEAFSIGTIVSGKYRIERVLGRGGMGMVVAAWHLDLDQRVALKFILADVARRPTLVERFMREARAARRLRGEHVAKVVDVAKLETGLPYIVMELLDGRDLRSVLAEGGALPAPLAVDYVLQAIDAVAEAHRCGIVHRDLKPANLFLASRPEGDEVIKLLDFGISKTKDVLEASGDDEAITGTSAFLGSPAYASPEQCRTPRDVDARTDIWALGAILYELLTGGRVFSAPSQAEMVAAVLMDEPLPVRASAPHVAPGLEAAVFRCLRKNREERFASVAALAVAIAPFGTGQWNRCVERAVRLLGQPPPAAPFPAMAAANVSSAVTTGGAGPRPAAVAFAISAGVVVAISLAVGAALIFGRGAPAPTIPSAEPRASATSVARDMPFPHPNPPPEGEGAGNELSPKGAGNESVAPAKEAAPKERHAPRPRSRDPNHDVLGPRQ